MSAMALKKERERGSSAVRTCCMPAVYLQDRDILLTLPGAFFFGRTHTSRRHFLFQCELEKRRWIATDKIKKHQQQKKNVHTFNQGITPSFISSLQGSSFPRIFKGCCQKHFFYSNWANASHNEVTPRKCMSGPSQVICWHRRSREF